MEITPIASGSKGNAYHISDGKTSLLLEAGVPIKELRRGCGFRLAALSGCLITHCHKDHSKAAGDLIRAGVDVYTGRGTLDACGLSGHNALEIKPMEPLRVGTFTVLPFDVEHDAPDSLGFLITSRETGERLLYITDTYYVKYTFDGLTHIMAECNYGAEELRRNVGSGELDASLAKRIIKSHMSLEHLKDLLRANDLSRVKQIYLLHLSDANSDEARFKREIQALTGAEVYVC